MKVIFALLCGFNLQASAKSTLQLFGHGGGPIDYVVTDPKGLKTGKNPLTHQEFKQIPDSSYYLEGIGDDETGEMLESDVERQFESMKARAGKYVFDVYSVPGGEYHIQISRFNSQGGFLASEKKHGPIGKNGHVQFEYNLSDALPTPAPLTPAKKTK